MTNIRVQQFLLKCVLFSLDLVQTKVDEFLLIKLKTVCEEHSKKRNPRRNITKALTHNQIICGFEI